jgi:hypothetical protein
VVVAFGVAEGLLTNRWHVSHEPEQAAERLAGLPLRVGTWEGEAETMDADEVTKAELTGYARRRYVDPQSGAALSVLLVCGRPGPIASHTPDLCYLGNGYRLAAAPERQRIDTDPPAELWVGQFDKDSAVPERLRIAWSWTATGAWSAPDNPRAAFARAPALYKVYVVRQLVGPEDASAKDPAADFLKVFLPQVHECLFPAAGR